MPSGLSAPVTIHHYGDRVAGLCTAHGGPTIVHRHNWSRKLPRRDGGTAANTIEIRQLTDVLQCKLHNHFQCNSKPSISASAHLRIPIRSISASVS